MKGADHARPHSSCPPPLRPVPPSPGARPRARNLARRRAPRPLPPVLAGVHGFLSRRVPAGGRRDASTGRVSRGPNKSRGENLDLGIRWVGQAERATSDLDRPTVFVDCLRVRESSRQFRMGISGCVEADGLRVRAPRHSLDVPCIVGRVAGIFRRAAASVLEQPFDAVAHPARAIEHPAGDSIHPAFSSRHPPSASKQTGSSRGRRPSIDSERRPSS